MTAIMMARDLLEAYEVCSELQGEFWAVHSFCCVLWFNLMRVEIHELRPEVVAKGDGVLVHYQSRINV